MQLAPNGQEIGATWGPERMSYPMWWKRAYHNLIHFNALVKGGHFAAWEQPQLFSEEVRAVSDHCVACFGALPNVNGAQ